MNPHQRATEAAKRLKVFPLPSAVLFPGTAQPLHIFEPRYCELVRHALETDSIFALGQLAEGWEPNYHGRPTMRPLVCVGTISVSEALDDGKYNLVLTGVCRARVVREWPEEKLYREVEAELLPDPSTPHPLDAQVRQALNELLARLPAEVATKVRGVSARVHGGALADVLGSALVSDLEQRYQLLTQLDVTTRLSAILSEVSHLLLKLKAREPTGPMN